MRTTWGTWSSIYNWQIHICAATVLLIDLGNMSSSKIENIRKCLATDSLGYGAQHKQNAGPRFLNRVDTLTVLKILGQKCWEGGHSSDFATSHWQWHGDPKEYGRIWTFLNLNVTCICIHVGPGSLIVSCRDHNVGLLARNSTYLVSVRWSLFPQKLGNALTWGPFTKLLPGKMLSHWGETGVSWIRNTPQLVADLWDESIAQRSLMSQCMTPCPCK